jgi:TM2 domain-containing membrane protein YozV
LLGWLGAHWFYLGRRRRGVVYLALLPLLLLPMFLGYADALRFLWVDRAAFVARWAGPRA